MINLQKERDGLTWVGKMVRDDSGTGWKRDGLSRIRQFITDHEWILQLRYIKQKYNKIKLKSELPLFCPVDVEFLVLGPNAGLKLNA